MRVTVTPIVIGALGAVPKCLEGRMEELEIRRRDHPDYRIVKIGQNTEISHGDLRRLVVTQTSVKAY